MPVTPPQQPPTPTGGSRPDPGTEEWRRTIEALLRLFWDPGPNVDVPGIQRRLEEEMAADPEGFLVLQERVASEFGFEVPAGAAGDAMMGLMNGLVDALTGAASGRARTIIENITETTRTTTERDVTETETVTGEVDVTTGRRETEFIEWDTPEVILDDFMTAVSTWVDTALRDGEISVADYSFVLANPERFLTPYLAEIGRLAEAGEVPSRVVGLEGAAERLGERFGGMVTEETTRVSEQERISDIELNELIESTIERLTSSVADGEPQDVTENIRETIEGVFREHRETTTSEQFRSLSTTITIEEIFGRPRLGVVRDPAPLDFLRERFPASTLANIAAGEGGPPSPRAGGARAVLPSAPRRLGG